MRKIYDLLVVGGGITGCEAAWQAASLGASVLLVSMSLDQLNLPPYISALFPLRGEIEEIFAELGETLFGAALERSIMGHFEHPDAAKDILVFDKREFSLVSKELLEKKRGLDARQALIREFRGEKEAIVESIFGEEFTARTAIISPGSYIFGRIRTGKLAIESGRYGDLGADDLGESLRKAGMEMEPWSGTIPAVLDTRKIETASWTRAKKGKCLFKGDIASHGGAQRDKPQGEERTVYWREKEGETQLLLPMGRKTSEAYLLRENYSPHGPEASTNKETIRGKVEQECQVMRGKGPFLQEFVRVAGSFGGARGYLECVRDGRKKAVEALDKST